MPQAKLTVNTPGDTYEQEADRAAEQVLGVAGPRPRSACACGGGCPTCRKAETAPRHVQTKKVTENGSGRIAAPPIVHEA